MRPPMTASATTAERNPLDRMLGHVTAIIAVGALVFYALGVIKTLGQLRASHVDLAQGLALIPLDRHLRNGVGIASQPRTLVVVGLWMIVSWFGLQDFRHVLADPPTAMSPWLRRSGVALCIALGCGTLMSFFLPWTMMLSPLSLILTVVLVIAFVVWTHKATDSIWSRRLPEFLVAGAIITSLAFLVATVYFASDPLPHAQIATKAGEISGPVITTTDGFLFVGARGKTLYREIPASQALSVVVTKRKREDERSVLQMIGLQ